MLGTSLCAMTGSVSRIVKAMNTEKPIFDSDTHTPIPQLEVVIGCMFSGKTTYLIKKTRQYQDQGAHVLVLNYTLDQRYGSCHYLQTHDTKNSSFKLEASFLSHLSKVRTDFILNERYQACHVVSINEGQFFPDLKEFCLQALQDGKSVLVNGLDGDFQQQPFGELLWLIPYADQVTRLHAQCQLCPEPTPAYFTCRKGKETEQVVIGGSETYFPVCRQHLREHQQT